MNHPSRPRTVAALAVLSLGTFLLASVQGLVAGVLPQLATDEGTPVAPTGTAYLLGLAVGGPLLTAASLRLGRRLLLLLTMGAAVLVIAAMALASGTGVLLVGTVAAGALYGLFFGASCVMAASTVPAAWLGRAVAALLGASAAAAVLSPTLGAWTAEVLSGRLALLAIAVVGLVSLPFLWLLLPTVVVAREEGGRFRPAFTPRVLAVLGVAALLMGAQAAMVPAVVPMLGDLGELSITQLTVILVALVVGIVIATFAGGWAADRDAVRAMMIANAILALTLALLFVANAVTMLSMGMAIAIACVVVWELALRALGPSVLHSLITLAGAGRHLAAPLLLSAVSAGSVAGGEIGLRAYDLGYETAILSALVICLAAVPLWWTVKRARAATQA
ncbi:MFS transporter [Nonomuraea africana]|uniref:MFS transporter n=1 Tax=Nonomuraea africana TaxID=46171 RepID=UPI00340E62BD